MWLRDHRRLVAAVLVVFASCGQESGPKPGPIAPKYRYGNAFGTDTTPIQFDDDATSNANTEVAFTDFSFTKVDGQQVALKDYVGKKNLVLVVTRGYASTGICIYCATQTSRLVTNYDEFKERDAEVLVVFPVKQPEGNKQQLDEFLQATQTALKGEDKPVPFPVLLDLNLSAVNQLDISEDLARPATYILDKKGNVRFAHVGTVVDRPSVKAMLAQLDALKE